MTISTLIGSRILSGFAALALTGSLAGGTAMAAGTDNPVREIRHEVRDASKAQREEIKQIRAEFAAEYAKDQPDAAKLEALQAAIDAKRSEISELRFNALMQMHDELDAKQRERLAERAGKGKGKGKHGGDKAKHGDKDKAERGDKAKAERGDKAKRSGKSKAERGDTAKAERGGDKAKRSGKSKAERGGDKAKHGKAPV